MGNIMRNYVNTTEARLLGVVGTLFCWQLGAAGGFEQVMPPPEPGFQGGRYHGVVAELLKKKLDMGKRGGTRTAVDCRRFVHVVIIRCRLLTTAWERAVSILGLEKFALSFIAMNKRN